jgi:hypothetical protein
MLPRVGRQRQRRLRQHLKVGSSWHWLLLLDGAASSLQLLFHCRTFLYIYI